MMNKKLTLQKEIDDLVTPLTKQDSRLAVVVGVLRDEDTQFFCYGHPFKDTDKCTTPDTIFEIASVTKVFTATLFALMVEEGIINLHEQVAVLLPEVQHIPPHLTLLELATHTAGLPAMPQNMLIHLLRNPKNPYARYTYKELLNSLLSNGKSSQVLPAPYNYSNVGYAILAYLLAKCLNQPYEKLLYERVCQRLGLTDTTFHLTSEQRQRLAPGFSSPGRSASNWEMGALKGAGGLFSTAYDLVRFLKAHRGINKGLSQSVRTICHQSYAPIDSRSHIGLGWAIDQDSDGAKIYWKDGASTGYRSFVGFNNEKKLGVVVLTNLGFSMFFPWRKQITAEDIGLKVLHYVGNSE